MRNIRNCLRGLNKWGRKILGNIVEGVGSVVYVYISEKIRNELLGYDQIN
jgi:hypothetical protein